MGIGTVSLKGSVAAALLLLTSTAQGSPVAPGSAMAKAVQGSSAGEIRVAEKDVAATIRLSKRSYHGNTVDAAFVVRFENLPLNKEYQFFLQDLGMKRDGLPPAAAPDKKFRHRPDQAGRLEFPFEINGFVSGEWIQFSIRSTDGRIRKTVRFTPYE